MSKKGFSEVDFVPVTLVSLLFISQIIVGISLLSDVSHIESAAYIEAGLYVFSGIVFGVIPVLKLGRKDGLENGQSYIHMTKLVNTGIDSITRYPQYVTVILWAIAGILLCQHGSVFLLGLPIIPVTFMDLLKADINAMVEVGDTYKTYMTRVLRANLVIGLIRRLNTSE